MKKYIKTIRLIKMDVDCPGEEWYHVRFFLDDGSKVERAWWLRIPAGYSDQLYESIFDETNKKEWLEPKIKDICIKASKLCWEWNHSIVNLEHLDFLHKMMEEE